MNHSIDSGAAMKRVLEVFPGAQRALFRRYHIGGCASCAFQPDETLEALCARNALNADEVIEHIKTSHQQDEELQISPGELAALTQAGPVRLVDVRAREEFEATHLDGALLLSQPVMQEILGHWPRKDLMVIYDHRGQQSLDAAAYFIGQGFGNVRCLRGGIDAWSREIDAKIPRYRLELSK
ncbi:MAG TPA: rhodanese-like domain-containing protein [Candidatus Baltobacteraceae bacterium]|jgi:rhodanese-related sulfurtransferase|nr:rhodanese-like domain-containing protein [Candidatus Baltobacteraceae bacterium]